MVINKVEVLKSGILVLFFGGLTLGCKRLCPGNDKISLVNGTVAISPDLDSIMVGDTLWLNSKIPTKLRYAATGSASTDSLLAGKVVDLSGASDVATDFFISVPTGLNTQVGGIDSFNYFIPTSGTMKPNIHDPHPNRSKTISYVEVNGEFIFSTAIVAAKKGIYSLGFYNIFAAKKNCLVASIQILLSDSNTHLHYLRDIYYGGNPVLAIDSLNTYCFKVY